MKIIQSRSFLAERYGICRQTMTKVLAELGITHRGHLTPLDLQLLINKYGTPEQIRQAQQNVK